VQALPMKMQFPAVWKSCIQHRLYNITEEALCVRTVLLRHRTDDVKSISSSNSDQHELLGDDLLLGLLRDVLAGHAPFRGVTKFQSKSTRVPSSKSSKFIFLLASRICNKSRQVSTRNGLKLSVN
jgi:hypothetical protein